MNIHKKNFKNPLNKLTFLLFLHFFRYVAWARVSGPSSDCGSSGQKQVTTEDQVQFYFKSSKKSNNGTDVNAGQLPQILYKMITNERPTTHRRRDPQEPICILTPKFAKKVTPSCFKALLSLIEWSWKALKVGTYTIYCKN